VKLTLHSKLDFRGRVAADPTYAALTDQMVILTGLIREIRSARQRRWHVLRRKWAYAVNHRGYRDRHRKAVARRWAAKRDKMLEAAG